MDQLFDYSKCSSRHCIFPNVWILSSSEDCCHSRISIISIDITIHLKSSSAIKYYLIKKERLDWHQFLWSSPHKILSVKIIFIQFLYKTNLIWIKLGDFLKKSLSFIHIVH